MKLLTTGATTTEIPEDPSRKASPAGKASNNACLQPVPVSDINYIDLRFIPNPAKELEDSPSSHHANITNVSGKLQAISLSKSLRFLVNGQTPEQQTTQMTMRAVKRASSFCIFKYNVIRLGLRLQGSRLRHCQLSSVQ